MENKLEQKRNMEFKSLDIKPRVYHFKTYVAPFAGITIVDERLTWAGIRRVLDKAPSIKYPPRHSRATRLLHELRKSGGIYSIAICDRRDTFNRQRGRIIAKGRRLKHLKELLK